MKIFEKWNKEQHHFVLKRETWRAAMEEVLGWLDHSTEHKEIADKIHEELES